MKYAVEIAQIIAALCAAIGLVFTGYQLLQSNKQHRISRVDDARREFYSSKPILNLYYKIEYDGFVYSEEFHESEEEQTLDKMLGIFDSLAKQVEMGLLSEKDLELISYEYRTIYQHQETKNYFSFLDQWYKEKGLPGKAFSSFRNIGEKI